MLQSSYDGESPPAYTAVSVVSTVRPENEICLNASCDLNTRSSRNAQSHRRHTTTTFPSPIKTEKTDSFSLTMPRRSVNFAAGDDGLEVTDNGALTAQDVARLLRATAPLQFTVELPRADFDDRSRGVADSEANGEKFDDEHNYSLTRSIEELVLNEAPIGQSTAAATFASEIARENASERDEGEL